MLDPRPLISVVLPVKDPCPSFLRAAVQSVLAQTLGDFELLLLEVPARGAMSAAAILQLEQSDARLRIIELAGHDNLVAQLNHGLELARARYVARMDADDLCEPHRLEVQRRFLDEHPEIDVVGSHVTIIDAGGVTRGIRYYPTEPSAIRSAMQRFNPMAHPAVMFRRQSVREAGGYRYPERAAQDYELWARMAGAGQQFANCDEALLRYRIHPHAIKARRVRETLESTVQTKREHFGGVMSWRGRLRLHAERAALLLPPTLALRLFMWLTYSPTPEDALASRLERRQTLLLLLGTGASALLGMTYMALAGRSLGPAGAADFYAALFFSFLLIGLFSPVSAAVGHFSATYQARGEHHQIRALASWSARWLLSVAAVLAVPAWLSGQQVARLLQLNSAKTLLGAYLIAGMFVWLTLERSYLRGSQRFGAYAASLAGEALLRLLLGLAFLELASDAAGALWPYLASSGLAIAALHLPGRGGSVSQATALPKGQARELLRFAAPMSLVSVADAAYQNLDVLFVKAQFHAHDAGLYGAMATLTRSLGVLAAPFIVMLLPVLSDRRARGLPVSGPLLRACARFAAISSVPLFVLAQWPEPLLGACFGEEFIGAAPLLLPHGASVLVGYLSMLIAQAFAATRRFAFLGLYAGGLALELGSLAIWHSSPLEVARVALLTKSGLLVSLSLAWVLLPRRS